MTSQVRSAAPNSREVGDPAGSVAGRWIGRSSSSPARSPSSAASRRWPARRSPCSSGEIVLLRGPNGAGKTTLLRVCAGLVAAGARLAASCSAAISRSTVTRCAGGSGCSVIATACTSTCRWPRTSASGGRRSARATTRSRLRWTASGSAGGSRRCRSGACRPGSSAAPRWPASWHAGPSCGCSTSPTPASTPTGRDELDAHAAAGGGVGRHRHRRQPRARPGRIAGHPLRRRRRRPGVGEP